MLDFIFGLIVGTVFGMFLLAFMIGSNKNKPTKPSKKENQNLKEEKNDD